MDDRDTRQKQALYLLSSGGFLSQLGISQTDLTGNIFEKFSGIFNDIFQDEEGKFNLGIDYVLADRRPGSETDGRFGVTVSSKINERVTFNGKVGVPFGGINETAIIGDIEIQYRVNEDGTLNLRMFNRENDINYISDIKNYCFSELKKVFPAVKINGENTFYNLLNVQLPLSEEKTSMLLFTLDMKGIAVSRGSACQSGSVKPSHVLAEFLSPEEVIKPSVRISFSHLNTKEDIDLLIEALKTT